MFFKHRTSDRVEIVAARIHYTDDTKLSHNDFQFRDPPINRFVRFTVTMVMFREIGMHGSTCAGRITIAIEVLCRTTYQCTKANKKKKNTSERSVEVKELERALIKSGCV